MAKDRKYPTMTTATKYDAAQQRPGCCCATTTCYGLLLKGEDITDRYGVGTLPAVYIIGADGRVVYRHEGVAKDFGSVIKKQLRD